MTMTEEELARIEARAAEAAAHATPGHLLAERYAEDVPALVAEVRALRALLHRYEWRGWTNCFGADLPACIECRALTGMPHRETCELAKVLE